MLVLTRKIDEKIVVGDGIVITIVEVRGDKVRVGVEAEREVPILRAELCQKVVKDGKVSYVPLATPSKNHSEDKVSR